MSSLSLKLQRKLVAEIDTAIPEQLTKQAAGIGAWQWAPDSRRIYFAGAERADADDKLRREKKFTVNIRNQETPLSSLWALDLDPRETKQLTRDSSITVADFSISDDGKWIGFRGISADRYKRNITEQNINSDRYLLEVATGRVERLATNAEVGESGPAVSPDGRWVAFSAPDDLKQYSMKNQRIYIRAVGGSGEPWRKLGSGFDGDVSIGFWSKDGNTIYFNEGIRATSHLMALDVQKDAVRQITSEKASLSVSRDNDSGVLLIKYTDGMTPPTLFTAASIDQVANRSSWIQLTDVNPQVRGFLLGEQEEITWKSKDGRMVGLLSLWRSKRKWKSGSRQLSLLHDSVFAGEVLHDFRKPCRCDLGHSVVRGRFPAQLSGPAAQILASGAGSLPNAVRARQPGDPGRPGSGGILRPLSPGPGTA